MIKPYANNAQSMQIGDLVIENQHDKVSIYGDIDLCCDQQGLADAQQLQTLANALVAHLQQIDQLPAKATLTTDKVEQTDNPFL